MTLPNADGPKSEQRPSVDDLKAAACAEIDRRAAEIVATNTRIQQHPETGFLMAMLAIDLLHNQAAEAHRALRESPPKLDLREYLELRRTFDRTEVFRG